MRSAIPKSGRHADRIEQVAAREPDPRLIVRLASSTYTISTQARPDLEASARKDFESTISDSMDAFWATDENAKASELRKLALEFLDSDKIREYSKTTDDKGD